MVAQQVPPITKALPIRSASNPALFCSTEESKGKQGKPAQVSEPLSQLLEFQMEIQAAGFSLDQPWLLQPFGK